MVASPLVSPEAAEAANEGPILAIERQQDDMRDTGAHAHAPGQLIGSLNGLVSILAPQGRWVLPATHAMWIPPHVVHGLRSHGPFRGWSVYVVEQACAALPMQPRTLRVSSLLRELIHRAAGWHRIPESRAERQLAQVLLNEIASLPEEPLGLPHPREVRLKRITDAVLADLSDNRQVEYWAAWAGIPPRTLARRFLNETGFSLAAWRQRARVLRAIEMLAEGKMVTTIAIDLGYHNVSAFIAMFRRVMGTTPSRHGWIS